MEAFFIVGHWNSGTTLLVDLLRKHPQLALKQARFKPELEDRTTQKLLRKMGYPIIEFGTDYDKVLDAEGFDYWEQPQMSPAELQQFQRRWYRKFRPRRGRMLLWKNPWLFFYPDFLAEALAEDTLHKVYILRDGRSQVTSRDYWLKAENPEKHLLARARFWVYCMEWFLQTWHQDAQCKVIRYETLTGQPEPSLRTLCAHAGLDFEPLQPHLPKALENRMSKWKALPEDLQAQVWDILRPMQEKLDGLYPVA